MVSGACCRMVREQHTAGLLLLAVICLWGANWPIMKVGLYYIPPLWFASARVLLGSACLFAVLAVTDRIRLPTRADMPVVISVTVLQVAGFLALVHSGLTFVDAGRSAILAYTTPLWVVPLAMIGLGERLDRRRAIGVVLGLAGVVVLFHPSAVDFTDRHALLGNGLLIAAAMSGALAIVHVRGHQWRMTPLQLMPWQLLAGGIILAALAAAREPLTDIRWGPELGLVLAYNGPIASAFCFWAFISVTRALPAMTTGLASLGVPLVGVLCAAAFLGEPLTAPRILGLALIGAGVGTLTFSRSERG